MTAAARARELVAYLDGRRTGLFRQDSAGAISFTYDEHLTGTETPLSLSMPLVPGASFRNRRASPWLKGLLSDNPTTLDALARKYQTSPNNPMGLLAHIGRDAAGAVQLLPVDEASDDAARRTGAVELIDFDELIADIVRNADAWQRDRDEIRWSLAGAQPKVVLHRDGLGRWGIPLDSTPTTHILKPALGDRHDLNEFLTMRAARYLGLTVAHHEFLVTGRGHHVFVSQRYDRFVEARRIGRLHQEDFAQALSVEPNRKYQADGGPSLGKMSEVFTLMPPEAQERARKSFFEGLVFTVASVNTDAHAKNYSVLLDGGSAVMAPLYDLGSNVLYSGGRPLESAVTIGGERRMDAIGRGQLLSAAKTLGVDETFAGEAVDRIRNGVAGAFASALNDVPVEVDGRDSAVAVAHAIAERSRDKGWTPS